MARLVVLDDLRPALGDSAARSLRSKYLLFAVELDGEIDDFLDQMYRSDPDFVLNVWGSCLGYPSNDDGFPREGAVFFRRYIEQCAFSPELPFAAFVDATVSDIASAVEVQSQLAGWVGWKGKEKPTRAEWDMFVNGLGRTPPKGSHNSGGYSHG